MFTRSVRVFVPAFILSVVSFSTWAHSIETTSHVVSATVFSDRALVTREAKTHISPGAQTVVIIDMPAGFDESSVRVQGKSDASVKIGTVEVKHVNLTELANAAEREKTAALEAKNDEKALLDGEIKALEVREQFIDRIVSEGADTHQPNTPTKLDFVPEKWAQAWGLVQTGVAETQKALALKHIAARKLDEDILKLQQDLNQVRSTQARQRRDVYINIEAEKETDLQLSVTYQTGGATWRPIYDARLETANSALALEQYGLVTQNTGEDWKDIGLVLSTAQPAQGSEMPRLYEWVVGLVQPIQSYALGGVAQGLARANEGNKKAGYFQSNMMQQSATPPAPAATILKEMGRLDDMQKDISEAVPVQAVAQTSEYAAEFHVPGHVDVKSANDPTKLFIAQLNMNAELSARVTPRLATQAFLFAKVTNAADYPLIPGTIAKYRDGAFIGNAALTLLRPAETKSLSFGVDDRVKVVYQRLRNNVSNPTLIVMGDMSVERQYLTKIENLHKDAVPVMVFEQYPVSNDADVKSELLEHLPEC